jgi:hypothetical protein
MTSNTQHDHLIPGLSSYPDLVNRLSAELRYSKTANGGGGCGNCKRNQIYRKYQTLLEQRRKKEPRR